MALEIIGKLIQLNPEVKGTSARGDWKKREMIIETIEQYPKKVCVSCFGERADQIANYQPGTELRIAFNLESREFNSRWYTDVRAWRIDLSTGASSSYSGNSAGSNYNQPAPSYNDASSMPPPSQANDDLPF